MGAKLSSTFKIGYNSYVNPILRFRGKDKAWQLFDRNSLSGYDRDVESAWKNGWKKAEEKKAKLPLEIN